MFNQFCGKNENVGHRNAFEAKNHFRQLIFNSTEHPNNPFFAFASAKIIFQRSHHFKYNHSLFMFYVNSLDIKNGEPTLLVQCLY